VENSEPLWRVNVGSIEPWRRGRVALIAFGILGAISQGLTATAISLANRLDLLVGIAAGFAFFWLQFYLIWIGVGWVRWLAGGALMLAGFAQMIWAVSILSGLQFVIGLFHLSFGAYVGFAPSVFFFARRQREKRDLFRSIATTVVFLLLITSLFAGSFGLHAVDFFFQREADDFARTTFDRVFIDHDISYLKAHSSKTKHSSPEVFVWKIKDLGALEKLEAPRRQIVSRWSWHGIELRGAFEWRAKFELAQRVSLHLDISGDGRHWEIEHVSWIYD